jgi:hypothetical protein
VVVEYYIDPYQEHHYQSRCPRNNFFSQQTGYLVFPGQK